MINTNYTVESSFGGVQTSKSQNSITDESFAMHLRNQILNAGISNIGLEAQQEGQYAGDIAIIKEKGLVTYMIEIQEKRLREEILAAMGLTEEDLGKMPPEQRAAIEKIISEEIQKRMAAESMLEKGDDNMADNYNQLQEIATGMDSSVLVSKMEEMENTDTITIVTDKKDDERYNKS